VSLYDVLGVPATASHDELRAAFRRRSRQLHPDHAGADDRAAMTELADAWHVLGDPVRRAAYDEARRAPPARPAMSSPGLPSAGRLRLAFGGTALLVAVVLVVFVVIAFAQSG
jgi:curved DNA-binding protein CbpA